MTVMNKQEAIEAGWLKAVDTIPNAESQETAIREAIAIGWDLLHPAYEKYRLRW